MVLLKKIMLRKKTLIETKAAFSLPTINLWSVAEPELNLEGGGGVTRGFGENGIFFQILVEMVFLKLF